MAQQRNYNHGRSFFYFKFTISFDFFNLISRNICYYLCVNNSYFLIMPFCLANIKEPLHLSLDWRKKYKNVIHFQRPFSLSSSYITPRSNSNTVECKTFRVNKNVKQAKILFSHTRQ